MLKTISLSHAWLSLSSVLSELWPEGVDSFDELVQSKSILETNESLIFVGGSRAVFLFCDE